MAQSTTGGLVQTILGLRQLEIQQQAQALAREQFAAAQQQFGMQMEQRKRETEVDWTGKLIDTLRLVGDKKRLEDPGLQSALADRFNIGLEKLQSFLPAINPSIQAVQEDMTTQGRGAVAPEQVAARTLTGQGQLPLAQEGFLLNALNAAVPTFDQAAMGQLGRDMAIGQATGQKPREADSTAILRKLTDKQREEIELIGAGLQMAPAQVAQMELSWAQFRQNERQFVRSTALQQQELDARLKALGAQAQHGGNEAMMQQYGMLNELIKGRAQHLQNAVDGRTFQTEEGKRNFINTLNLYTRQIEGLLPPGEAKKMGLTLLDPDADLAEISRMRALTGR